MKLSSIAYWLLILFFTAASSLSACPVCFGDKNDQMTAGMKSAIWVMLGITLCMLGIIGLFFIKLRQRLKHQQSLKSDTSFVSNDGTLHIQNEQGVQEWNNI
jgi:heme/copper-type cytochrome/quinol oxidase subunit 2